MRDACAKNTHTSATPNVTVSEIVGVQDFVVFAFFTRVDARSERDGYGSGFGTVDVREKAREKR